MTKCCGWELPAGVHLISVPKRAGATMALVFKCPRCSKWLRIALTPEGAWEPECTLCKHPAHAPSVCMHGAGETFGLCSCTGSRPV
jgi:hypothetical protein